MSRHECPEANTACKYWPDCYADRHHPDYPRAAYTTKLEKAYRAARVVILCRSAHDELHSLPAPDKPAQEVMRSYLEEIQPE